MLGLDCGNLRIVGSFSYIDEVRNNTWSAVHRALQGQASIDFGVMQDFWFSVNDNPYKDINLMVLYEFYD